MAFTRTAGGLMSCFIEFNGDHTPRHLHDCEGGNPAAEVVVESVGPSFFPKKHIGTVRYEPIHMSFGPQVGKRMFDWINDQLKHTKISRADGAILRTDMDLNEVSRLTFNNAVFTELTLPESNANRKEAIHMSLSLAPEYTKPLKGGGGKIKVPPATKTLKMFSPSNFRFEVKGPGSVVDECKFVSHVDAVSVKQSIQLDDIGAARDKVLEVGKLEFSNLAVTLPENHAHGFYAWFEDFVIHGNCSEDHEVEATLRYLSPDMKETVLEVTFHGVGPFRFAKIRPPEGAAESVRRVKVEMYVENFEFTVIPKEGK